MARRNNKVFAQIKPQITQIPQQYSDSALDVVLHALLARVALDDNNTIEFQTRYDPLTKTIEVDFPEGALPIFDELLGMQRGPRMQAYINWLIGRQAIIDDVPVTGSVVDFDQSFVSSGAITIWAGATIGNIDNDKVVIFLPTDCLSVIGYNTKMDSSFTGNIKVSLVWVFEGGNNTSFDIQTSVSVNEIGGNNVSTVSNDVNISTFNLIKGDIRETDLLTVSGVQSDDMISIVLKRNYDGSTDAKTEFVGVLGIKITNV